jgi:hypothetical protein
MTGTQTTQPTLPADPETARRHYRLLKIGTIALLVLACAFPLSLNLVDPDLWGHVRYGQDWLEAGELPRTASHTYAAEGHPWVNHENAAELLLAIGFGHLPVPVMLVVKCLFGLSILLLMVWVASGHGVSAIASWALMLVVSANLQAFFPMRPQLLSFGLLAAVLLCLDRAFREWHPDQRIAWRWLGCVPVLFVVWVNSHGAFAAGLCIVCALLAGRMVELAWWRGRSSWRMQGQLALVGTACVLATLINPYGWGMHEWLMFSLGSPRPEITEWAPPLPHKPVFWPLVLLLAVGVGSWAGTKHRRDWPQIVVMALVSWQACLHLRHIALVALLAGFWLPMHFSSALARLRPGGNRPLPTVVPAAWLRFAMFAAILVGVTAQSLALANRLSDFPVYRDKYPVDALQWMVDHRLRGKLVASFNWAQYAIGALAPHVQVGFDGRFRTCYPQEVVDMHFDFLLGEHEGHRHRSPQSPPIDGTRVLEFGNPDLVLVDRRYPNCVAVMEAEGSREDPEWTLLYRDPIAEIWGRTSRYAAADSPHYLPPSERETDVRLLQARFQWPALPDYSLWEELEAAEAASRPAAR